MCFSLLPEVRFFTVMKTVHCTCQKHGTFYLCGFFVIVRNELDCCDCCLWLSGRARKPSFIDLLHEPAYDLYGGSAVGFLAVPGILTQAD